MRFSSPGRVDACCVVSTLLLEIWDTTRRNTAGLLHDATLTRRSCHLLPCSTAVATERLTSHGVPYLVERERPFPWVELNPAPQEPVVAKNQEPEPCAAVYRSPKSPRSFCVVETRSRCRFCTDDGIFHDNLRLQYGSDGPLWNSSRLVYRLSKAFFALPDQEKM